jgi:thiazole/oxazole-forming peptide maturase SagC family component
MSQDRHFRIKRHYSIIAHSPDVVELRWGVWNPTSFTITDDTQSGRLYRIIRRFDGSVSVHQLAKEEGVAKSDVEAILDYLIQLGVVEHGATNALDHYLDTCLPTIRPLDGENASAQSILLLGDRFLTDEILRLLNASLPDADVSIVDSEDPAYSLLSKNDTTWLMNGIEFHERLEHFEKWKGTFIVFATKIINPVQLRILNRVALALRIPWIHSAIDGPFLIIGPTFVPYRSACYECFETRVMMNVRETAGYQRYKNALIEGEMIQGTQPVVVALGSVLASHVALETINFAKTKTSFTVNNALAIHLPTMEFSFNELLRVPSCISCSSSPERDDTELHFDLRSFLSR